MTDRRSKRQIWILIGALTVVTAAVVAVASVRSSTTSGGQSETTDNAGFGDMATIDPCGFATADAVVGPNFDVQIRPLDLRSCQFAVRLRNTDDGAVLLWMNVSDHFDITHYRREGLTFRDEGSIHHAWGPSQIEGVAEAAGALELLYRDNGTGITISGQAIGSAFDNNTGRLADGVNVAVLTGQVADAAARTLAMGPIRHLTYPADSAASVDLCSHATQESVQAALDFTGARRFDLARNTCKWSVEVGETNPSVQIRVRLELTRNLGDSLYRPITTMAGRPTAVYRTSMPTAFSCVASTRGKTWNHWLGYREIGDPPGDLDRTLTEVIELAVDWPADSSHTGDQACRAAERIAADVWPSLP
ncbi:hypothetical protein GPX89_05945 [Nocardia sp. ET3-3]|uniref:DUF3558 domain-containing protein n=1 Tax=Nocardia terrae TaxID=2675851 RepID=A0A7K1USB1_9NOCA|nr:hypothetical protein [Nocardia terrae]MVU76788.1 hypothetical protein [Nocardia terrae]